MKFHENQRLMNAGGTPALLVFFLLIFSANFLHATDSQLLNDAFLSKLRTEAARKHPAVASAKLKEKAASQDIRAVRLWNDPMVGIGFMGASEMMRKDDGDIMIGIEQSLPKPGMFEAERRKMQAMTRAEQEKTRSFSDAVGAEAVKAAIELALTDESIVLQQAQVQWISEMAENARQMAANPGATSTDALRMETELAREKQMLESLRRSRKGFAQKLNIALGRPLDSAWKPLRLPAAPPPVPIARAEIARISYANPKIRAMKEMVSAAGEDARIADRERLPAVSVGVDARIYSGSRDVQSLTAGVKLSLPWFNDPIYQAKIDAAKNREAAAGRDVETMRREIAGMVSMSATEAANAASEARTYSGEITEKAQLAVKTTEAAWISSKAPLTDLLDSSRMLFSIRLQQRRMIAMQLAALEDLQTLVPPR